jgi:hypothetical protein
MVSVIIVLAIGAVLVAISAVRSSKGLLAWSVPLLLFVATLALAYQLWRHLPFSSWMLAVWIIVIVALVAALKWFSVSVIASIVALLTLVAFATGSAVLHRPAAPTAKETPSASSSPSASPTATPVTLNAKAANWVRSMALNFEGVTDLPAKCQNYVPTVDLTEIHWYARDDSKESPGAFGTSMGDNPCDIAINRVERAYRDPFYVLQKANEIKEVDPSFDFVTYTSDQQATRVTELQNAPFAEREALADKVLGWYSDPSRVLKIEQKNEAYVSAGATSSGSVVTAVDSQDNKASTVVTTADRKTGQVIKQDRVNCGDQPYKPTPPPTTPPTCVSAHGPGWTGTYPICKDPWTNDPQAQGHNKPGGGGVAPPVTTGPSAPAAGNPPATYTPPAPPAATHSDPPQVNTAPQSAPAPTVNPATQPPNNGVVGNSGDPTNPDPVPSSGASCNPVFQSC